MKKTVWLASALLAALLTVLPLRAYAAPARTLTVTFHYDRLDQDYEGFHIWSWTDGAEGQEYDFSGVDEYGAWVRVSCPNVSEDSRIGFLIKINDWEPGEVRTDRFLDLSRARDGALDVYIRQGESAFYYSAAELPDDGRFLSAYLDSTSEIRFQLMRSRTGGELVFTLTDDGGTQYPVQVVQTGTEGKRISGTLSVEGLPDLRRTLYLSCGDMTQVVRARAVFDTPEFQERFCYTGDDLGAVWSPDRTAFRLWAPTASAVEVLLYRHGTGGDPVEIRAMEQAEGGTWYLELPGDFDQVYYTYRVTVEGSVREAADPYAKACGLNGQRGMILDLSRTEPESFYDEAVQKAGISSVPIVWEMSVRDFSMDGDAGFANRGTYRAVGQGGVKNSAGDPAGIDYLEELGVTYVQIMPAQDSPEVDEGDVAASYNWGYMTRHYFIPEGAYSVNPGSGGVRIQEFKGMVGALHQRGIGVVMDVVYNHTAGTAMLEDIVPGYYYRLDGDGGLSNGSACGNELASERTMARKLILDSACYWLEEYHVDGFRLDLMGLLDLETLQALRERLAALRPDVLLYGEGWTGGESSYEGETGMSVNAAKMPGIGVFNNIYRRAIQKYVCGTFEEEQSDGTVQSIVPHIRFGIAAAVEHPSAPDMGDWTQAPVQCVNYASCHDGYALWDLIRISAPGETQEAWEQRNRFAASVTLLAQGIPFFQSGEEFLRSKTIGDSLDTALSNTYKAGDEYNSLKWALSSENKAVAEYYKGLIAFRKAHPGMLLDTAEEIRERLVFLDAQEPVIAYTVQEKGPWWQSSQVCVVHNPLDREADVTLPDGNWKVYVRDGQAGTDVLAAVGGGRASAAPVSTLVLVRTSLSAAGRGAAAAGAAAALCAVLYAFKRNKTKRTGG